MTITNDMKKGPLQEKGGNLVKNKGVNFLPF